MEECAFAGIARSQSGSAARAGTGRGRWSANAGSQRKIMRMAGSQGGGRCRHARERRHPVITAATDGIEKAPNTASSALADDDGSIMEKGRDCSRPLLLLVMPGLKREARLRADVLGIHVWLGKKVSRGWPGQAPGHDDVEGPQFEARFGGEAGHDLIRVS